MQKTLSLLASVTTSAISQGVVAITGRSAESPAKLSDNATRLEHLGRSYEEITPNRRCSGTRTGVTCIRLSTVVEHPHDGKNSDCAIDLFRHDDANDTTGIGNRQTLHVLKPSALKDSRCRLHFSTVATEPAVSPKLIVQPDKNVTDRIVLDYSQGIKKMVKRLYRPGQRHYSTAAIMRRAATKKTISTIV